jgi:hypothetical protein
MLHHIALGDCRVTVATGAGRESGRLTGAGVDAQRPRRPVEYGWEKVGGPLAAGNGEPALGASLAFTGGGGMGLLDTLHDPGLRMGLDPAVGQ